MMGAKFLQDNDGNSSSMRLGTMLWLIGVLVAWIFVAIATKTLPEIPMSVAGIIGMILTGKVAQKGIELYVPNPKDDTK